MLCREIPSQNILKKKKKKEKKEKKGRKKRREKRKGEKKKEKKDLTKSSVLVHICSPSPWEEEARELGIQGQLWLCNDLEAGVGNMKSCLKNKRRSHKQLMQSQSN